MSSTSGAQPTNTTQSIIYASLSNQLQACPGDLDLNIRPDNAEKVDTLPKYVFYTDKQDGPDSSVLYFTLAPDHLSKVGQPIRPTTHSNLRAMLVGQLQKRDQLWVTWESHPELRDRYGDTMKPSEEVKGLLIGPRFEAGGYSTYRLQNYTKTNTSGAAGFDSVNKGKAKATYRDEGSETAAPVALSTQFAKFELNKE